MHVPYAWNSRLSPMLSVPGVRRRGEVVMIPRDMQWAANRLLGREPKDAPELEAPPISDFPEAKPWQLRGVAKIKREKRVILSWPVGSGKTKTALHAIRGLSGRHMIITPRMVIEKGEWERAIQEVWPDAPPIFVIQSTKKARQIPARKDAIIITSWELIKPFIGAGTFASIIFDEAHKAMNTYNCIRAKQAQQLFLQVIGGVMIGLTGTIINSLPQQIFGVLELIFSGQVGNWFTFIKRYFKITENEYTKWQISGVREETQPELRYRLKHLLCQLSPAEEASLTQHITVKTHTVPIQDYPTNMSLENLLQSIDAGEAPLVAANQKQTVIRQLITGSSHKKIVLFTHFRESAERFAELLKCRFFSGDLPPKARVKAIEAFRTNDEKVLVCTMHSVREGINLGFVHHVIYGEMTAVIGDIEQSMGRFSGMRTSAQVDVDFVTLCGTKEEKQAYTLTKRLQQANALLLRESQLSKELE